MDDCRKRDDQTTQHKAAIVKLAEIVGAREWL
jgi:hypothetical protein